MRRVDAPTSFTDVMTLAETGERTFFNMHGADSLLQPGDVDAASLGCDIFHLGYLLLLDGMDGEDGEFGTAAARLLANLHCPELGLARDAAGRTTVVPSLALPKDWIKGSVGAGDAFCAGMLYATLKGMPDEEGLRLASCAAAANLAAPDSISGAMSLADTLELERRFARR